MLTHQASYGLAESARLVRDCANPPNSHMGYVCCGWSPCALFARMRSWDTNPWELFGPVAATKAKGEPKTDPSIHRNPQRPSRPFFFRHTERFRTRRDRFEQRGIESATGPGFPTTGNCCVDVFRDQSWKNSGEGHLLLPHAEQYRCSAETEFRSLSGKICREVLQGHPWPGGRGILPTR